MGPLKTFYCQEIEKWLRSKPGRVVTVYQIGELLGNAYKRAATGEIPAIGFRGTGLFPCDKNIFRPHDFPLALENTDAAHVNPPALAKTSDQPSFSSAEALRSSVISPVPSLNLKPNPRGRTAKKITSSPYKKVVEATQKKKIKQATKSKTNRLASNALLVPLKRRKRRVCWDPTPFADDSAEEDEEQDADCLYCTGRFSEDRNGEDWIRCAKCFKWRTRCVLVWRKVDFVCEHCQG